MNTIDTDDDEEKPSETKVNSNYKPTNIVYIHNTRGAIPVYIGPQGGLFYITISNKKQRIRKSQKPRLSTANGQHKGLNAVVECFKFINNLK